jgi:hypothetical protein
MRIGEARDARDLIVRIGIWNDMGGEVIRARFQASTCVALIAYTDATCELIESGVDLRELDAARIRASVADVHPAQQDRAALVADAVASVAAVSSHDTGGKP